MYVYEALRAVILRKSRPICHVEPRAIREVLNFAHQQLLPLLMGDRVTNSKLVCQVFPHCEEERRATVE